MLLLLPLTSEAQQFGTRRHASVTFTQTESHNRGARKPASNRLRERYHSAICIYNSGATIWNYGIDDFPSPSTRGGHTISRIYILETNLKATEVIHQTFARKWVGRSLSRKHRGLNIVHLDLLYALHDIKLAANPINPIQTGGRLITLKDTQKNISLTFKEFLLL